MQSQGIKSDWRVESEWRHKGDVQLSSLPPDSLCCFCHTKGEARHVEKKYGMRALAFISNNRR